MLVLSRKPGEKILIGEDIRVTVVEVKGNRVKLGIEAPDCCRILQYELADWVEETRTSPAPSDPETADTPIWVSQASADRCLTGSCL